MSLLDEVREKLASTARNNIRKIKGLPESAPGYIIRDNYWYGVAVPYNGPQVEENFSNARIRSTKLSVNGDYRIMLALECGTEDVRRQFASLCVEFLEPGTNNADRHALLANPYTWWKKWRELLGNAISEKKPYQILGELLTLEYLIKNGAQANWQGASGNTQDIDADDAAYEVKSTLGRYTEQVTISSKFQLSSHGKPVKLVFVRFEPSVGGDCLKNVIERLTVLGCDETVLLHMLARQGVVPGNQAYTTSYNLLEMRFYDVDDSFPLITDPSFVGGHMPERVVDFIYTIDLKGIPYRTAE